MDSDSCVVYFVIGEFYFLSYIWVNITVDKDLFSVCFVRRAVCILQMPVYYGFSVPYKVELSFAIDIFQCHENQCMGISFFLASDIYIYDKLL